VLEITAEVYASSDGIKGTVSVFPGYLADRNLPICTSVIWRKTCQVFLQDRPFVTLIPRIRLGGGSGESIPGESIPEDAGGRSAGARGFSWPYAVGPQMKAAKSTHVIVDVRHKCLLLIRQIDAMDLSKMGLPP